jgi:hypothetical protein
MGKDEEASKSLLENLRAIQMRQLKQPEVGADGQPVEMGSVELVGLKDDDLDDDFIVGEDTREEVYEYIPDFHRNFDYCLVFPLVIKIGYGYELTQESVELTVKLKKLGAILFPYLSFQKDELFVLIRFPVDKLKRFAEKSEFVFALDPVVAEEKAAEGNEELKIAPIEIPFDKKISIASEVLRSKQADCFDQAVLLTASLRAAQIPSRIVYGLRFQSPKAKQMTLHAWGEYFDGSKWLPIDSTSIESSRAIDRIRLSDTSMESLNPYEPILSIIKLIPNLEISLAR